MTYLDIARSVSRATKETKETKEVRTAGRNEHASGYEKNECDEKSPEPASGTPEEAERLKVRIIAAVTVEPERFDRETYDRLWARWMAHEVAGGAS